MNTNKTMTITLSLVTFLAFQGIEANAQTETASTATSADSKINFPENTGELPRAGTPEAGAQTGDRADTPQGGTPTEWRHQATPPGGAIAKEKKANIQLGGYLRVIGQYTENDALPYIGRNDGFRLGNARIEMATSYGDKLTSLVSIEASAAHAEGANDPNATFDIGLRDAYLNYEVSEALSLKFGRFKAPYDLGELESTGKRIFIDAPVETRGVSRTRGIELEGMSQGRQVGLWLGKDRLGLSKDGFDIGYGIAVTNGKTNSLAFNDNDRPAGFLRLSALYGQMLSFNLGGFVDMRTQGELPNQFDEEVMGGEVSLQAEFGGLRLEAQGLVQITKFTTTGVEDIMSMGFHGQWAYRIGALWNLEVAYRFGYFDPNDRYDLDRVTEHTLGFSYLAEETPLRLSINGTFADEERPIDNNRVEVLAQYTF
jgi:hypothetical protein